ncbi:regulator [Wenjunlia vitaminophila]|uniref:Regulator n=1 Tax=Wenjunlia vitaminophila TaxID=76728 RepID=A0A0T6LL25_WENVI|nr:DUF397 domain-containing protein [Wenjunlia vitaminophila]KRV46660.1 regulator [Wenjunlia vitaminophila]
MKHEKEELYLAPLNGQWIKSAHSAGNGGDCVQLMAIDGGVALGDSKSPEREPLRYTHAELAAFLHAAKAGEFDHLVG